MKNKYSNRNDIKWFNVTIRVVKYHHPYLIAFGGQGLGPCCNEVTHMKLTRQKTLSDGVFQNKYIRVSRR